MPCWNDIIHTLEFKIGCWYTNIKKNVLNVFICYIMRGELKIPSYFTSIDPWVLFSWMRIWQVFPLDLALWANFKWVANCEIFANFSEHCLHWKPTPQYSSLCHLYWILSLQNNLQLSHLINFLIWAISSAIFWWAYLFINVTSVKKPS